jgi:PPOX class probable F420-dependent enzyme
VQDGAPISQLPRALRPRFQRDYGVPTSAEGMLPWEHARTRLQTAQNYWIATVGSNGAPQVSPVWAIWYENQLLFSCGRSAQKARNLARNPKVVVNLESGAEVVILHGTATEMTDRAEEPVLIATYRAKYGQDAIPNSVDQLNATWFVVRPKKVLAWLNFPADVTRWDFP